MNLYSSNDSYKLYEGNMLDMLEVIDKESIDSIVTDPPYGLTSIIKRFGKETSATNQYGRDGSFQRLTKGFMGKVWDGSGIEYNIDTWRKCYEVLKPGGYLLAFGGSRTFHRIACAIEDAGFEIRDTIMWIYGSGFPKSMSLDKAIEGKLTTGSGNKKDFYKCNGVLEESKGKGYTSMKKTNVEQEYRNTNYQSKGQIKLEPTTDLAKEYYGWGTALKPSYEPIIVARKPFDGSLVDNVLKYGVGGLNINECRVGDETISIHNAPQGTFAGGDYNRGSDTSSYRENVGRFPANTILTYDESDYDEVCGGFPNGGRNGSITKKYKINNRVYGDYGYCNTWDAYQDSGSASRYFYCAKASKKDRDEGLDSLEIKKTGELQGGRKEGSAGSIMLNADGTTRVNPYAGIGTPKRNNHPTVKPTELMQYLIRLVTPKGGVILDPFNGSGSTGKAVMYENNEHNKNYKYIGIEITEEYLPISKNRIEHAYNSVNNQLDIFSIVEEDK